MTALFAGVSAGSLHCGGDDSTTDTGAGTGGRDAGSDATGDRDASTDGKSGAAGSIGSGGNAGAGGSGGSGTGGGGSGGAAGGARDGASDGTLDVIGDTGGKGGAAGNAGSGGAAGIDASGGAAGSGGSAGTDGGSTGGASGAAGSGASAGASGTGGSGGSEGGLPDGSDAATDVSVDAGDGGSIDAGPDGSDGGAACAVDNTPCTKAGGNGLCKSQVCAQCVDGPGPLGDDTHCGAAYGGAYLCLSGVCTPGDCRTSTDCISSQSGPLCGIAQSNTCGKCSTDAQCLAANAATPVCSTSAGVCIVRAGSCSGQADNAQCTINSADVCCGSACTAGTCCPGTAGDTLCKTRLGSNAAVCSDGYQCTTCDAVSGFTFIVDPLSGNDGGATGSGTSSGSANAACAFKSITRALQSIGSNPAPGTVVQIRNTGSVSVGSNGESFPINVTGNVMVTATGGPVTITTPIGQVAFSFAAPNAGINGTLGGGSLVIDGAASTAFNGVAVTSGATATTTLENVTIQNFLRDGIRVADTGMLTIKQGVTVTNSGTAASRRPGLHVTGNGHVDITVPSGQATTSFNGNTQHGILVDGASSVTILGAQSNGTGTIECRGNYVAGLAITQTPSINLPANSIDGLLAVGTTAGNGIRIEGGSNAKVRNSHSLGNFTNGIIVITNVIGNVRTNTLTNIDLGKASDPGGNVFQATIGSNANISAGICLQMDPNSGTLSAEGNRFSAGKNCATTPAALTFSATSCGSNRDLGLGIASGGSTAGNDIDVLQCTHP